MKLRVFALAALLSGVMVGAQETGERPLSKLNVAMDARVDYALDKIEHQDATSGVHGRYLNMMVNGNINDHWSYAWRQRMNKFDNVGSDIFSSTDWAYLTFAPNKNFAVSAGKQVVLIGGYEYDAAPIDIYFASRFWNNIACYQFGASGTYTTDNGKHHISLQICNSPFLGMSSSCYAYNLYWTGRMGCYETIWSVNMIEYAKGKYSQFVALGNKFYLGDFFLQLDFMNRAISGHPFFFHDYSIIAEAKYNITPWMTVMVKGGKDDFHKVLWVDEHHDNPFYGAGFEFYPMHGSRDVRIHALYDMYHDNDGVKVSQVNIGLKWRVNLFSR